MPPKIIGSYADLDKALFFEILENFRSTIAELKATSPQDIDLQTLYVRDWALEDEEGRRCVQVFLEKIIEQQEQPIDLNDCIKVHKWFLNTGNFDIFEDGVDIEMGSCGTKPRLREAQHFGPYLGQLAQFHFWREPVSSRPIPPDGIYFIESVDPKTGDVAIKSEGGVDEFLVGLKNIKSACVNPPTLSPNTKKSNKNGQKPLSKKGKNQPSSANL